MFIHFYAHCRHTWFFSPRKFYLISWFISSIFYPFFFVIHAISFFSFQTVASCWRTRRWIRTQSSTATTVSASWWATRGPNSCGVRPPQSSCMGPSPRSRPRNTYGRPWLHVPKDRSRYCTIGKMVRLILL